MAWEKVSGNIDPEETGIGNPIQKDQIVVSASVRYQFTRYFRLGAGYQHGFATDDEQPVDKDLFEYDTAALLATFSF